MKITYYAVKTICMIGIFWSCMQYILHDRFAFFCMSYVILFWIYDMNERGRIN